MNGYVGIDPFVCGGAINAPPSKSAAHRELIAACLAGGGKVTNIGDSVDVLTTLNALKEMGASITLQKDMVQFGEFYAVDDCIIDCKESGSTLRFLLPLCCVFGIKAEFIGSPRLIKERPSQALIDVLNERGAYISDMRVNNRIMGGKYVVDGSVSSQFVTGLLFALSACKEDSTLTVLGKKVSGSYVDMTLKTLSSHGIEVKSIENGFAIKGGQKFLPKDVVVEGDWSSAAFPLCFAAISGEVEIFGLDPSSTQGDKKILDVLRLFGADVEVGKSVKVRKNRLRGVEISLEDIPDLAQIIAVVAAYAEGESRLCDLSRLAFKESDRFQEILSALTTAGIQCSKEGDDIIVKGGRPHGGRFDCAPDHRSVMSAAVLAACASSPSEIAHYDAVSKSYPSFFEDMIKIGGMNNVKIRG